MNILTNDDAWHTIFQKLNILNQIKNNGYYDISAQIIKRLSNKEPRLMTKIDHREYLPSIMTEHSLSILAIKNGLYRISTIDPFINIKKELQSNIKIINTPKNIMTIDPFNLKGESAVLDIAHISGILEDLFNEKTYLTIRGRIRADFSFIADSIDYEIEGVQIEVDGGYEGAKNIYLIEAKMGFRNNINMRQILYPYLYWKTQVKTSKKIISYILYYQDNIFRFIPIIYKNNQMIALHEQEKIYRFNTDNNMIFSLSMITKSDTILVDENTPFPQANDFEKIHAILLNIDKEEHPTKINIASNFDIVPRQHDYYFNVLKWLKLCEIHDGVIRLTNLGNVLLSYNIYKRMVELAKIIFSEPIFYNVLKDINMKEDDFKRYGISASTIKRRIQTVQAWIKYFDTFFERLKK